VIAQNLAYLPNEETEPLLGLAAELGRILNGLISSIKLRTEN